VYVSGVALSPDFPYTSPASSSCGGFLAKLNPLGTGIVWSVCLTFPSGGPIALDRSGFFYVLGGSTVRGRKRKGTGCHP
jgi:hypothetical protein